MLQHTPIQTFYLSEYTQRSHPDPDSTQYYAAMNY